MALDLDELERTATAVSGWSNCDKAWLDTSEDVAAAAVGAIGDDGAAYPVAIVDCDLYFAPEDSLKLAKFYASANPSVVLELVRRLREAESEHAAYVEGSEEAFRVVVEQKHELQRRVMQLEGAVADCGKVIASLREQQIGA